MGLHILFAWYVCRATPQHRAESISSGHRTGALQVRLISRYEIEHRKLPRQVGPIGDQGAALRARPRPDGRAVNKLDLDISAQATEKKVAVYPSSPATAPGYIERMPQGDAKVMQHGRPMNFQATRFESAWVPARGTSSIDDALRRARDAATVAHTFTVVPGVRVRCQTLLLIAGGCGEADPPPQPTNKSRDMRLSMASAQQDAGTAMINSPSEDACIALYRADQPLPHGCPADTPTRAVNAELRVREFGARHDPSIMLSNPSE